MSALKVLTSESLNDWATLVLSLVSLVIAFAAAVFTKNQRDVSVRAEKYRFYVELLEILYFLKSYDGEITPRSESSFKQLLIMKSISSKVFSDTAGEFIDQILKKMVDIPVRKSAYEQGVSKEAEELYEKLGIDSNIHDALAIQYIEIRSFFSKDAFENFERIFKL
tara:strand:+ start:1325 stop:1822 length:498 start_codon:yes stop_codon:yes gene_type:complete